MVRRKTAEASLVGKTSLRVRFSEVDSMQIVWHGEYVRYFEDGREAFGREFAGLGYMDIHASGYTAPIVELQLQYKKPLRVNDTAVVETRYIATEAAKICFEYTIRSGTDGEIVAEGSSTQVFLDARGELQLLAPGVLSAHGVSLQARFPSGNSSAMLPQAMSSQIPVVTSRSEMRV